MIFQRLERWHYPCCKGCEENTMPTVRYHQRHYLARRLAVCRCGFLSRGKTRHCSPDRCHRRSPELEVEIPVMSDEKSESVHAVAALWHHAVANAGCSPDDIAARADLGLHLIDISVPASDTIASGCFANFVSAPTVSSHHAAYNSAWRPCLWHW